MIPINIAIPGGQTYAFYVTSTTNGMRYTNGTTVGAVAAGDGNLQILEGTGVAYSFGSNFAPRIFNGNVYYEACP